MMARVLIPLADGGEEMEIVIIVDVLRRAGWNVVLAGVDGPTATASRQVGLVADALWQDVDPQTFDILLLPGGMGGTNRLLEQDDLLDAIRSFEQDGRIVGAICAGPLVLQKAGILSTRTATCHPGVRNDFHPATVSHDRVVWDARVVTSQAPGTAMAFALAVIRTVDGEDAADAVAAGLVLPAESAAP